MTKLIQTKEYLLLVDSEAEIEPNEWIVCDDSEELHHTVNHYKIIETFLPKGLNSKLWKKIIGHRPLNNAPKLEGVLLLPAILPIGKWVNVKDRKPSKYGLYDVKRKYSTEIEKAEYSTLGFQNHLDNPIEEWFDELPKQEEDVEKLADEILEGLNDGIVKSSARLGIIAGLNYRNKANTARYAEEDNKEKHKQVIAIVDRLQTLFPESDLTALTLAAHAGYEANKAKWTDEDMLEAYRKGVESRFSRKGEAVLQVEFIQSLSSTKTTLK